jgi:type IV pilus assembly protein PilF
MTEGLCQIRAGQNADAEKTLMKAYEFDAGNPVIGYNLAALLAKREDWTRAQFYVRRVNNGPSANAETLWLGVKVERKLNNREAVSQLGEQLQNRFPQSREATAYERGNFND